MLDVNDHRKIQMQRTPGEEASESESDNDEDGLLNQTAERGLDQRVVSIAKTNWPLKGSISRVGQFYNEYLSDAQRVYFDTRSNSLFLSN